MKKRLVAAIYARKSVILQKGDTLNIQEEKCRRLLKYQYNDEYDLSIKCYTDEKSGKDMDREAMQMMISDIQAKRIQAVCAYKLDRFGRNATDLLNFIELLKENGVKLFCVDDKIEYDPTDETQYMTKFLIMFLSLMAELERNNIRQRVIVTKDSLSRHGFWLGGTAPYGFEAVRVPNDGIILEVQAKYLYVLKCVDEEMQLVESIYTSYLNKMVSFGDLANMCNDAGYVPRFAERFDQRTIQGMLMNPVYVKATEEVYDFLIEMGYNPDNMPPKEKFDGMHGLLTYGKTTRGDNAEDKDVSEWIVAVAPHDGVIDAKDWIDVQRKIISRKGKKDKTNTRHNNVLIPSGMFRCGCCGGIISSYNRKSRNMDIWYPHYRCENKRKRKGKLCDVDNISATVVDEAIIDELFRKKAQISSSVDYIKQNLMSAKERHISESVVPRLEREKKRKQQEINNLISNLSSGKLSIEVIEMINQQIIDCKQQITELENRVEQEKQSLDNMVVKQNQLDLIANKLLNLGKSEFMTLPMDEKKSLIALVIDKVVWDGDKVHIYFKIPDIVCGGNTTDSLFIETALTSVETVKQHF